MAITRSFSNNFEVVDYTQELKLVPNSWTLLGDAGLFENEFLSQRTVSFEEHNGTLGLVNDIAWGAKQQTMDGEVRKLHSYNIGRRALVDQITPEDLQGKSAYGNLSAADTEAAALARKMEKIRKSFDVTHELSRFKTIVNLQAYYPGTSGISYDYAADFGITRKTVDFALSTATTEVIAKVEEVIAHIQDNMFSDSVATGITAYCSPEFFAALVAHPKIVASYQYYASTQDPLRSRLGGMGLYRTFLFQNVLFVEVRTVLAGQRLVPSKEAYFVPNGVSGLFKSFYAPVAKMEFVNTIAEEMYLFSWRDQRGNGIDLEAESNYIDVCLRPALVVKATTP